MIPQCMLGAAFIFLGVVVIASANYRAGMKNADGLEFALETIQNKQETIEIQDATITYQEGTIEAKDRTIEILQQRLPK